MALAAACFSVAASSASSAEVTRVCSRDGKTVDVSIDYTVDSVPAFMNDHVRALRKAVAALPAKDFLSASEAWDRVYFRQWDALSRKYPGARPPAITIKGSRPGCAPASP